ncbi:Hpt domain-containing protein [Adlercreutzia sp. R25]|uniref:Hpt domain-containing protein n=1 Tax=Adlercreutzia shanghongiae TaxID=3111773 RepID=A0ABU6J047_9ACTN|nr:MULTISPECIES: Hpt domain-containing protein [unclassified Adlercreutzia]MEC4273279.1 Hpt domain-containing protein [Adlercreutzia sp. R25]MEC4295512.1 Hpt domain-containing protein [Adlercreutzia sp. R22]
MTAELAEKLRPFGIDYVDAMDRFGDNADLYERLALKYLDDGHLVALQAAMEAKDFSEGYSQAHALKGVAGNLSFKDLYECATLASDALYAGEYDAAEKHLPEVERAHQLVIEGLEAWRDNTL